MDLRQQRCTPCRGGIPPLSMTEANDLLASVPGWMLEGGATRLRRHFGFPDFVSALAFVNRIGALAEEEGHHPDLHFGWGYVDVVVYTHAIAGLHVNDYILAAKIDALPTA
ncbi:4a-hydroxytetrahydrobiopterin dehydratase [Plasticicumulans acidivorans]|uniref:Putative pterin-4-alpha-carbinolamine dehydratase n=1 Tax=Plasticicumulans acidivorans TaxID=886464 RepID=A0A317MZT0_9GAMM|nr:4a-hydroxytetrahydrobiopterin dehydratase [Plasticicumulans acidivorans]PWV65755.1 pterin-4-alpha-carbinolamine dehydratase [Plasticicumulans acidivorans]